MEQSVLQTTASSQSSNAPHSSSPASAPRADRPPRRTPMTVSAVSPLAQTARVPAPVALATPRWTIYASHSHVGFAVRHLMISNVRGEFTKLEGSAGYDPE